MQLDVSIRHRLPSKFTRSSNRRPSRATRALHPLVTWKPRGRASVVWTAVITLGAACLPPSEADESPAREPVAPRVLSAVLVEAEPDHDAAVVLVVLDGVRWQEVLGGRRSHACLDNDCAATRQPTVFDEAAAASPGEVSFFASWERLDRAASASPHSLVLSTGRTRVWHGEQLASDPEMQASLDRGAAADPTPGWGEFRPDRFTAGLALKYLEQRRPRLDHGRGRDWRHHGREFPESGRVWIVATGAAVKARGILPATRKHHLADVAPTIRQLFFGLAPDAATGAGAPIDELFGTEPLATATLSY